MRFYYMLTILPAEKTQIFAPCWGFWEAKRGESLEAAGFSVLNPRPARHGNSKYVEVIIPFSKFQTKSSKRQIFMSLGHLLFDSAWLLSFVENYFKGDPSLETMTCFHWIQVESPRCSWPPQHRAAVARWLVGWMISCGDTTRNWRLESQKADFGKWCSFSKRWFSGSILLVFEGAVPTLFSWPVNSDTSFSMFAFKMRETWVSLGWRNIERDLWMKILNIICSSNVCAGELDHSWPTWIFQKRLCYFETTTGWGHEGCFHPNEMILAEPSGVLTTGG